MVAAGNYRELLVATLGRLGLYQPLRNAYQRLFNRQAAAHRQHTRAFFSEFVRRGNLVFDIGANDGRYTGIFIELGARVVAVEPNPALARSLRQRFGTPVEQVAIGAEHGTGELHLGKADIFSSLSSEWMDIARREQLTNEWTGESIPVTISTLDGLIARHGVPDYVKIDVEGFELEVLRGLSQQLPVLSFEVQGPALHIGAACVQLLDALGPYKFSISPLDRHLLVTDWLDGEQLLDRLPAILGKGHGDIFARPA
jgi:FkbM family methyltransferase